jgi:alcohol dehydrogenase class IV
MRLSRILPGNVIFGFHSIAKLKHLISSYKQILLVSGERSYERSGASEYFAQFGEAQRITRIHYSGKALPVEDAQDLYSTISGLPDIDLIIAVGGGTVIDLAKLFAFAHSNNLKSIQELLFLSEQPQNRIDLVFVPTTAGTGSEATSFAVLYKDKVKQTIAGTGLEPKYIVLDPAFLVSLPERILNSTILDALSQAIESAWAVKSTAESLSYSEHALSIILNNLGAGSSPDRLGNLLLGSFLAGRAINIAKTTASHAISYPLTALYGIPHGIAVFLSLPRIATFNFKAKPEDLQKGITGRKLRTSFKVILGAFKADSIEKLTSSLYSILHTFGFSARLRDYGIKKTELSKIASSSMSRGRSDNNPRVITPADILQILEGIY